MRALTTANCAYQDPDSNDHRQVCRRWARQVLTAINFGSIGMRAMAKAMSRAQPRPQCHNASVIRWIARGREPVKKSKCQ